MVAVGDDVKGLLDLARPMFALYIGGMGAKGKNFYNNLAPPVRLRGGGREDPGALPRRQQAGRRGAGADGAAGDVQPGRARVLRQGADRRVPRVRASRTCRSPRSPTTRPRSSSPDEGVGVLMIDRPTTAARGRARVVPADRPRRSWTRRSSPTTRSGRRTASCRATCGPRPARSGCSASTSPRSTAGPGSTDFRYNLVMAEELTRRRRDAAPGFVVHTDIIVPYLTGLGTDEQKRRWLPGCVSGETVTAVAMTEPGAGSDLQGIRTTAVDKGDHYLLNGSKTFISNGIMADLVIVVARTDPDAGHKGISLLVVERGMAGFERGRNLDKIGLQGPGHRGAVLRRRRGAEGEPARRGGLRLRLADDEPARRSGCRSGDRRRRPARRSCRCASTTPRSARPSASRSASSSTTGS